MKILFTFLIIISATVSAQKKDPTPKKMDTLKVLKSDDLVKNSKIKNQKQYESLDKMPVAKPNGNLYSGLKEQKKDHSKYKILNPITPEEPKKEVKK